MKVVVIGAGVVGSAFAWHLAKEGTEVTVLEQGSISSGASSKSFGWLNSHYPELPEYHALRMASLAEHRNLDAGAIAQWHGSLWWEQGDETIEQHQSTLLASGQEAELLDHTRIQAIVPGITCPQGQAILSPAEGAADPGELANYFLDRARQHNTRVVCGIKVMVIEGTLSDGYRVKTASGVFRADRVVIAPDAVLAL